MQNCIDSSKCYLGWKSQYTSHRITVLLLMVPPNMKMMMRDLIVPRAARLPSKARLTHTCKYRNFGIFRAVLTSMSRRAECVACGEIISGRTRCLQAPCMHYYCQDCLRALVTSSIGDESLFPLRCCKQSFNVENVLPFLQRALSAQFQAKAVEFGTPAQDRLYCPNATCSIFLGSSANRDMHEVSCTSCRETICTLCKQAAHPGAVCSENAALLEIKALARDNHWQTCPGCGAIIELGHGCYHMTCRCRAEWCYVCATPWKNCACPQWDEHRLLDTARQRAENELGARAGAANPVLFQRRVQERVVQLRGNHDCDVHAWRRRNGGGHCQECAWYLREFLLVSSINIPCANLVSDGLIGVSKLWNRSLCSMQ